MPDFSTNCALCPCFVAGETVSTSVWNGPVCSICETRREAINAIVDAIPSETRVEPQGRRSRGTPSFNRMQLHLQTLQQSGVECTRAVAIVSELVNLKNQHQVDTSRVHLGSGVLKTLACATLMIAFAWWMIGHGIPLCCRSLGNGHIKERNYVAARDYYGLLVKLKPLHAKSRQTLRRINRAIKNESGTTLTND